MTVEVLVLVGRVAHEPLQYLGEMLCVVYGRMVRRLRPPLIESCISAGNV